MTSPAGVRLAPRDALFRPGARGVKVEVSSWTKAPYNGVCIHLGNHGPFDLLDHAGEYVRHLALSTSEQIGERRACCSSWAAVSVDGAETLALPARSSRARFAERSRESQLVLYPLLSAECWRRIVIRSCDACTLNAPSPQLSNWRSTDKPLSAANRANNSFVIGARQPRR